MPSHSWIITSELHRVCPYLLIQISLSLLFSTVSASIVTENLFFIRVLSSGYRPYVGELGGFLNDPFFSPAQWLSLLQVDESFKVQAYALILLRLEGLP